MESSVAFDLAPAMVTFVQLVDLEVSGKLSFADCFNVVAAVYLDLSSTLDTHNFVHYSID